MNNRVIQYFYFIYIFFGKQYNTFKLYKIVFLKKKKKVIQYIDFFNCLETIEKEYKIALLVHLMGCKYEKEDKRNWSIKIFVLCIEDFNFRNVNSSMSSLQMKEYDVKCRPRSLEEYIVIFKLEFLYGRLLLGSIKHKIFLIGNEVTLGFVTIENLT